MKRVLAAATATSLVASVAAQAAGGTSQALCEALAKRFASTVTLAQARSQMAGVTYRSFSPGHGNQVEHATRDGRVFLWYPGNAEILPGSWKVESRPISAPEQGVVCDRPALVQVCFRYSAHSYNPVTGSRGANWDCEPFSVFQSGHPEIVPGDPLGLATMKRPPFALSRANQSIAAIKAQLPAKP